MVICGMNKLTLIDYPDNIAAIIFTQGCQLKCPFCHNSSLIGRVDDKQNIISEEEIINYLKKRKNVLKGLVISGGEPTLQKDLKEFIKKIKSIGLKIKLDTNGFNPDILDSLIKDKLIDYVAVDIKNDKKNYGKTSGINSISITPLLKTIDILKSSNVDYEFRTTIMKDYHTLENIENIIKLIGEDSKYYLQNFKDSEGVLHHELQKFTESELQELQNKLNEKFTNVIIRDL